MGNRTRAQRDAITIEIGYALVSAFVLAVVTFVAVVVPADLLLDLPGAWMRGVLAGAGGLAVTVFVVRVVYVLWGYRGAPGTQPSQPGRTSPDS
ncbi:hypothetical protein GCM10010329_83790 [Streptomyces spiroverticillatus]|uniref:Uncharacterized protein n=1 Tax=Streptomyces finlayi TaxID=67296 RepID=A0A918X930_9ACTN|nr:DUF6332 family protein [Streptomyces finlayi]GHA48678.1 hypothetical protein GCM10010329_83790 [Streptomyces spiroverticillatus]GHD19038.1 hypothetical protein GCM10010334_82390 [Streptomyces finlayi]